MALAFALPLFALCEVQAQDRAFNPTTLLLPEAASSPPTGFPIASPATTTSASGEVFGGTVSQERKIVGLAIRKRNGRQGVCSGLWTAPNIIVTAGHCLCDGPKLTSSVLVTNIEKFKATETGAWIEATGVTTYPGFTCNSGGSAGVDLGLVFLKDAGRREVVSATLRDLPTYGFLRADGNRPVCENYSLLQDIPTLSSWYENRSERVSVGGFGFYKNQNDAFGIRRVAQLKLNSPLCIDGLARSLGCRPFAEFILGAGPSDWGKRDTCSGDSGGPAFVYNGELMIPIGIVSRGLPISGPLRGGACGAGGIYTHLGTPEVLTWLALNGVQRGAQKCSNWSPPQ